MTIEVKEFSRLVMLLLDSGAPITDSELQELYPGALERIVETSYAAVSFAEDTSRYKICMNEVRIASLIYAMCVLELLKRKSAFKSTELDEIRVAFETIICYY